jgi:osmotically-inducible protein OsmY
MAPDNSGNDVNEGAYSSQHPGGNDADAMLADKIRASLMQDDKLSNAAKNVEITIANGKVTLRGTVKTRAEKKSVETKARDIAGAAEVESRLQVKK